MDSTGRSDRMKGVTGALCGRESWTWPWDDLSGKEVVEPGKTSSNKL